MARPSVSSVRAAAVLTVAAAGLAGCATGGGGGTMRVALSDRECMARVMYFESNRSSDAGMIAVGTVVMNRLKSGKYGTTVCQVVGAPKQFAPGVLTRPMTDRGAPRAYRNADAVFAGKRHYGVQTAMFFHTYGYRYPYRNMHYLVTAGGNTFYEKRQPPKNLFGGDGSWPAPPRPSEGAGEIMVASNEPKLEVVPEARAERIVVAQAAPPKRAMRPIEGLPIAPAPDGPRPRVQPEEDFAQNDSWRDENRRGSTGLGREERVRVARVEAPRAEMSETYDAGPAPREEPVAPAPRAMTSREIILEPTPVYPKPREAAPRREIAAIESRPIAPPPSLAPERRRAAPREVERVAEPIELEPAPAPVAVRQQPTRVAAREINPYRAQQAPREASAADLGWHAGPPPVVDYEASARSPRPERTSWKEGPKSSRGAGVDEMMYGGLKDGDSISR